ncbi:MAG: serine/threonine-protein phosphatase [Bryobacterales bacterium]|nr:serine/threonine-protein phosphatase [Bryobacterales bacterium]
MVDFYGLSDKGCVRSNNEDAYGWAPELGLYILADGMGGANAGERASQLAVQTVIDSIRTSEHGGVESLIKALEQANHRVLSVAKGDKSLEGMGTTLVAALVEDDAVRIASVGDSRAYMLQNGTFCAVTEDQSWVHEVGRVMGLDEATLRSHPLRHVLTMAIGAGAKLIVNRYSVDWKPGSTLLLCSDGLHGVVHPEKLEEILRQGAESGTSLKDVCERLVQASLAAGAPDNVTVVLLRWLE